MTVVIISRISSGVDTATLAANTALLLDTLLGNIQRNFMWKNIKTIWHATIPNIADRMLFVLANSDATVAQVATALSNTEGDIENRVAYENGQQEVRVVWDIQPMPLDGAVAGGSQSGTIDWKIPPKGIPTLRGGGLSMFMFNMSDTNAFTNGPSVVAVSKCMGGWF